jgi:uncharacterized protein (TIGR03435 family)
MNHALRAAAVALLFASGSVSQETKAPAAPAFDVVSVKAVGPAISHGPGPGMLMGLRYTATRVTGNSQIFALVEDAYGVKHYQINGPDWARTEVYEIAATMPEGTTKETAHLMIRTMLEQRFSIKVHREPKEVDAYGLVEAKGGSKLHAVNAEQAKEKVVDTPMGPRKGISSFGGPGRYAATATTMGDFADWMTNYVGRPVVNATSLTGLYEMDLRWDPKDEMDLIAVIDRQLGLKMERRKISLEMLVIDHVDKVPTEN